ncbi:hypothetical protein [Microbacterium pseudoresistens]|uniref:Uncharacterized protein n=1 Tax=Microbacterium pseudoresistens TaxID=640634 RepID=A0A7Y9JM33_9MICO|nr:hypothetical protein [Microbacterium pseudoresistens]NYD53586.1 hypothetical protein [Microbacterium pseudoresistens]
MTSYWSRLCAANAISQKDLWLALRHIDRMLPILVTPRSALGYIEALGGLTEGTLVRDSGGVVCGHGGATRQVECPSCRRIPAPVTLCGRCAAGDQVTVTRIHGPVCVRHRVWLPSGAPVVADPRHLAAQRQLNGSLALRGVPYRSPEVSAAAELLHLNAPERDDVIDDPDDEFRLFPSRITLTGLLTDPRFARVLMSHVLGAHALAMVFDRLVAAHALGHRAAEQLLEGLKIQGRELWVGASAVPVRGGCALTPAARRILPRAKTIRAHMLHHRVEVAAR